MGKKRKFSEPAEADPGAALSPASAPAPAPATAQQSSRSDSATQFFPSPSFSKCVTLDLDSWWLHKSVTDFGGKRLAVGGMNAPGKYARVFTSKPIVKRHDTYTLEAADGLTVRIQGLIDQKRTHEHGVPFQVSKIFLNGFPFNWEQYADGDFREMSISPTVPKRFSWTHGLTSGIDASNNLSPEKHHQRATGRCSWRSQDRVKKLRVDNAEPAVERASDSSMPTEADPGVASSAPATAQPSSRPDSATPFSPSSFSKCVTLDLDSQWLLKSVTDSGGKRLAVGGMNAPGVSTLTPIIKRHKIYTLEAADGTTIQIQGFINQKHTHEHGVPSEVSKSFSSLGTLLHKRSSSSSFYSFVASQPVESSGSHEMDKSNQNCENGVEGANITGPDNVNDGLHDGVSGESSLIADDTVAHLSTDMEEKLNDESERILADVIAEGVSNDASPEEHHQRASGRYSVRSHDRVEKLRVGNAELAAERASNSSVPTERDDSNNKRGLRRYPLRSRVRKFQVDNAGRSDCSVGRKDSKESYANSIRGGFNIFSQDRSFTGTTDMIGLSPPNKDAHWDNVIILRRDHNNKVCKWRCKLCNNEYSNSCYRVKNHFMIPSSSSYNNIELARLAGLTGNQIKICSRYQSMEQLHH